MGYTASNGLPKISYKFQCVASSEKRMQPCAGCSNPQGCLTSTMHYKESLKMTDNPTVELLPDGSVKCAKSLPIAECGYKAGDKVCGKCGATAIQAKSEDIEVAEATTDVEDSEWVTADMDSKGGKKMPIQNMVEADMVDAPETAVDNELQEPNMDTEMTAKRKKARKARLATMGVKSEEIDDDAFVCAFERKVLPNSAQVCASCPGGCASEDGMPSLLEIEGIAMDMFSGKVLDSGYADKNDMFVVDIERKDGKPIEAFFDGTSGECLGWHMLNSEVIGEVTEIDGTKVISFADAGELAVKSIEGDVVSVDADMFEGHDAYAVEVDGLDGKSYDVYVSLDGEVLGWDEYEAEEAADIDAEIAEIALKAAYDTEARAEMADAGEAMPEGEFPIKNGDDLKNAIQAYGRAGDKVAAMAHIKKRAKELDMEDMLPESWAEDAPVEKSAESRQLIADMMELELLSIETDLGE